MHESNASSREQLKPPQTWEPLRGLSDFFALRCDCKFGFGDPHRFAIELVPGYAALEISIGKMSVLIRQRSQAKSVCHLKKLQPVGSSGPTACHANLFPRT